jgi:hypothetical protein
MHEPCGDQLFLSQRSWFGEVEIDLEESILKHQKVWQPSPIVGMASRSADALNVRPQEALG